MTLLLLLAVPFYATLTDTLFMLQRGYGCWPPLLLAPLLSLPARLVALSSCELSCAFAYQRFSLTSTCTAHPNFNQLHGIAKDMKKRKLIGQPVRRVGHPLRETM